MIWLDLKQDSTCGPHNEQTKQKDTVDALVSEHHRYDQT
jgi:hypothetical protein